MENKEIMVEKEWLGRPLTMKTGLLARQADAAVTVQYGDTVILATVVETKEEREGIDFFPLMVEFEERLYAAGIIKGSRWIKREGRPTDDAILTGRMIDRSVRPLFDQNSRNEVQVVLTVLSVDKENDHDVVSLVAASAALSLSGIKWAGPISGIRVGLLENELIFNPTYEQRLKSRLDLIVAGTDKKVIMIEAGANEVKEERLLEAIMQGLEKMQPAIDLIEELKKKAGVAEKKKKEIMKSKSEIEAEKDKEKVFTVAKKWLVDNAKEILFNKTYYTKTERKAAVAAIKDGLNKYLFEQSIDKDDRSQAKNFLVEKHVDSLITEALINDGRRVDGRALDEIRPLSATVELLPRNHGSGLFSRGETQILSVVTLGATGLSQTIEGMEGTSDKRFMHHYNFPPYSVGEARFMRGPGRREIGHGALAEKALIPVMPAKEDFPYTIRVVSETLGSNGSSSMGSTCGSTLALMDAGVPIKKPVAGIAIGLASNDDMSKWVVLTDIQDLEDGKGGMDFKITGTDEGITAIQLDTKTNGLNEDIIRTALNQARKALDQILKVITTVLPEPRKELSQYAPRIISFHIDPEKIRDVIGTGGKIINKIIATYGVEIDIEDDGLVMVCGVDAESSDKAVKYIKDLTRELEAGEIFKGKVVRMLDFGAFIELTPGRDGMAHVSELAPYRIGKPADFLSLGDEVMVKIKEIDDQGRVNLTMVGLKENEPLWANEKGKEAFRPSSGSYNNRNGGGSGRGNDSRRPSRPRFNR